MLYIDITVHKEPFIENLRKYWIFSYILIMGWTISKQLKNASQSIKATARWRSLLARSLLEIKPCVKNQRMIVILRKQQPDRARIICQVSTYASKSNNATARRVRWFLELGTLIKNQWMLVCVLKRQIFGIRCALLKLFQSILAVID